jgi:cobalt-zinc-cadmium efflux system membrane fusion protein
MNRIPFWTALLLALALSGCGDKKTADAHAESGEHAGEDEHTEESKHAEEDEHAEEDGHAEGGDAHAEGEEGEHAEGPPSTKLSAAVAAKSGIKVAKVAPGTIADEHEVQGLLTPIDGRVAQVMARFPGPIRSLRANIGDQVRAGQALASIESNLSLTTYTVTAPISGVVLQRNASVGGVAAEGMALYEIGDLSELWVDLHVFGADAQHITAGSPVLITRMGDQVTTETVLERILPSTATASQSTIARARVRNTDGMWRPGSAVRARVTVAQQPVALMVPQTALQTMENMDVVFVRTGETYTQRPVKLGKRDPGQVEILSGLKAGEEVVTAQSFLIKADIEKSTAEHDH